MVCLVVAATARDIIPAIRPNPTTHPTLLDSHPKTFLGLSFAVFDVGFLAPQSRARHGPAERFTRGLGGELVVCCVVKRHYVKQIWIFSLIP